jgi:hypothetical protein
MHGGRQRWLVALHKVAVAEVAEAAVADFLKAAVAEVAHDEVAGAGA